MSTGFYKYHGTGNDFILMDNRDAQIHLTALRIKEICNRRLGIGADGIILLEHSEEYDFFMRYFNADGSTGSMCGNGGRCITAFAARLGIISAKTVFGAADGVHHAEIISLDKNNHCAMVSLGMNDVTQIEQGADYTMLNTGSPHYVKFVNNLAGMDVVKEGRAIRNSEPFRQEGINVNFLMPFEDRPKLRTYERGVEDETLSCGTGAVAAALALDLRGQITGGPVELETPGGILKIDFQRTSAGYKSISLTGPAALVFEGVI